MARWITLVSDNIIPLSFGYLVDCKPFLPSYSILSASPFCFYIQAYLILLCFILLSFTDVVFSLIESKTLHQPEDHDLLYCDTHFITVIWNQTYNISKVWISVCRSPTSYLLWMNSTKVLYTCMYVCMYDLLLSIHWRLSESNLKIFLNYMSLLTFLVS